MQPYIRCCFLSGSLKHLQKLFCLCCINSHWPYLWSPESLGQNTLQPQLCYKLALWNSYTLNQTVSLKKWKWFSDMKSKGIYPKSMNTNLKTDFFPSLELSLHSERIWSMLYKWSQTRTTVWGWLWEWAEGWVEENREGVAAMGGDELLQ